MLKDEKFLLKIFSPLSIYVSVIPLKQKLPKKLATICDYFKSKFEEDAEAAELVGSANGLKNAGSSLKYPLLFIIIWLNYFRQRVFTYKDIILSAIHSMSMQSIFQELDDTN